MSVNQNIFDNNPSFLDSNKKVLFNINWDLNPSGVRQLELDALKCVNSNINNIVTLLSPIDGSTLAAKTTPSLYFARTRLIKLIDVWNRILNSGLFISYTASGGIQISTHKVIGSNLRTIIGDYLFRNLTGSFGSNIDFDTINVFNRLTKFLVSSANNINWYLTNNVSKQSLFVLTSAGQTNEIDKLINVNFNPTSTNFLSLMNELLNLYKELISETRLFNLIGTTFNELTFDTAAGRTKIIGLDAYKSNFAALAKIDDSDLTFLNDETRALVQTWKDTGSNNIQYLYPQFATAISRNTESETWNFRNVAIDTSDYNQGIDTSLKKYQTKYILCSQLDMKKPLVFSDQIINWTNPNDRPYLMVYNSGTYIYIPDEIKEQSLLNTLGEQPDNQVNISAYFWKIGTNVITDPNYDASADVKLKLGNTPLYNLDKIDFLDNLTIYLKIN